MVLVAYRHGLRAVGLRWDQVDFDGHRLHARQAKKGNPSRHLLQGGEMRALRKLQRDGQRFCVPV
jgi:integrase